MRQIYRSSLKHSCNGRSVVTGPEESATLLRSADEGRVVQPDVMAKWTANAPLAFIDQYIDSLRRYHAIAIDVGDQDGLRFDTQKLHAVLDNYGIKNSFEMYQGTHTSAVADRFQNHVMPFFSQNLCFTVAASDHLLVQL